ncbi:hypothetical protein ACUUL3_04955 [Thiovibrio sp. JS02]
MLRLKRKNLRIIGIGGHGCNIVNTLSDIISINIKILAANTDTTNFSEHTKKSIKILPLSFIKPTAIINNFKNLRVISGISNLSDPAIISESSKHEIFKAVRFSDVVLIVAGMGGKTGTAFSPIVAQIAQNNGAHTIAVVSRPFTIEGKTRWNNSTQCINALSGIVDSLLIVSNDVLSSLGNLPKRLQRSDENMRSVVTKIIESIELARN